MTRPDETARPAPPGGSLRLPHSPGSTGLPARLGVVVPARNEESHIAGCLAALDLAARVATLPLDIVVVLDSCDDNTRQTVGGVAEGLSCRVHAVRIDAGRVGTARRVGVDTLLESAGGSTPWVATTDADTVVPPDWFLRQLDHRRDGASLVVGTVNVNDWLERSHLRPHWERAYRADADGPSSDHRHVHGANLSFDATAYAAAGGFDDGASDEDVRLVRAFEDAGQHVVWASDLPVTTSARGVGRAPQGFATYLNRLALVVDTSQPILELR